MSAALAHLESDLSNVLQQHETNLRQDHLKRMKQLQEQHDGELQQQRDRAKDQVVITPIIS